MKTFFMLFVLTLFSLLVLFIVDDTYLRKVSGVINSKISSNDMISVNLIIVIICLIATIIVFTTSSIFNEKNIKDILEVENTEIPEFDINPRSQGSEIGTSTPIIPTKEIRGNLKGIDTSDEIRKGGDLSPINLFPTRSSKNN